jgi:hypothetical protein
MKPEQAVTLDLYSYSSNFYHAVLLLLLPWHIAPKYIYAGCESHLEMPVILVVDVYIDLAAYTSIAINFE